MTFALDLQKFAEKAGKRADIVVGQTVAQLAATVDFRSPVGDAKYWKHPAPKGYVGGRFRANWNLGIGAIDLSVTSAVDTSGKSPDRGGNTTGTIIAQIPEEASGKVYYLSNSLPYAQRLEDGWSRQAPQGILARTAAEFQSTVDEAVAEAKRQAP